MEEEENGLKSEGAKKLPPVLEDDGCDGALKLQDEPAEEPENGLKLLVWK